MATSAKVHSNNTSLRVKAKQKQKLSIGSTSTNQSSIASSSSSSSSSSLHGKDEKLAALLQQKPQLNSIPPPQPNKQETVQGKDKGQGKSKDNEIEKGKGKGKEKQREDGIPPGRKPVFRPVLNSPFTVNWPTIPSNLSQPLLHTLLELLSHESLAPIRGKGGETRDKDKGNGRKKRKKEGRRKFEEKELREEQEGERWGEEILKRNEEREKISRKMRGEEFESNDEKEVGVEREVEAEGVAQGEVAREVGDVEMGELDQDQDQGQADQVMEYEIGDTEKVFEKVVEKSGDEETKKQREVQEEESKRKRELSNHFTIGLNSVTKKLEEQISKASAFAIQNRKGLDAPSKSGFATSAFDLTSDPQSASTSTSDPSDLNSAVTLNRTSHSDPPISMVFVCTKDIDPPSMISHFPLLTCAVNAVSSKSFDLISSSTITENQSNSLYPPILLIPLPEDSSSGISKALYLRRVSTIALSFPLNSNSDHNSEFHKLLKPLIEIIKKTEIQPLRISWLDVAAESSVLNGKEFGLNNAGNDRTNIELKGPIIKHVRTTAPVDKLGKDKKREVRKEKKLVKKEKKRVERKPVEGEMKREKKRKRLEVGDGDGNGEAKEGGVKKNRRK